MKKLMLVLLAVVLFCGLVNAGDWGSIQTCSATTARKDTVISTNADTMSYILPTNGLKKIAVHLVLDDLPGNTAEDSFYVFIWGAPTNSTKTSGNYSSLQTIYWAGSDVDVAKIGYVYIEGDATYIYKYPYLMATVRMDYTAGGTDSVGYYFYWVYEKE